MSATEGYLLPNGRVLRYTFHERLTHWISGFSFVYALLTGLSFWTPWLFWIAAVLGGYTISRELHPWAGVIFVLAVIQMFRMWAGQMRSEPGDEAWWRANKYYITNQDDKVPATGRLNPGQKVLFWGFFWCGLVLVVSGLVLWFPNWVPWNLRYVRYIAVLLHVSAALLSIGMFMIHVYMGTAFERGAFGSVIRGDVSRSFALRHHRIWYEQIVSHAPPKK